MKKIILLTGSELRHTFFRKYLASSNGISVVQSYCEGIEKSLRSMINNSPNNIDSRSCHMTAREQSEEDMFQLYVDSQKDFSKPIKIKKGEINSLKYTNQIINYNPNLLIAYGCSIIKKPLLSAFKGRFINVHLGLSPYYRGSGTNYWPLVNNEP